MKKVYLLLAVSTILTLMANAQDQNYSFSESYKVNEPAQLTINNSNGHIAVSPHDNNTIEIYYTVRKSGRLLNISKQGLAEYLQLEEKVSKNEISIRVTPRKELLSLFNSVSLSFKVLVPSQTSTYLATSDGHISLTSLTGDQVLKSSDGHLSIATVKGNVDARTSDGNIQLADVSGFATVQTSDGNISARKVMNGLKGRTSDGHIKIEGINQGAEVVTSDGHIECTNVSGDISLTTSDGSIQTNYTQGNLKLRTSDGSIAIENMKGAVQAITSDGMISGNILAIDGSIHLQTSDGMIDVSLPDKTGYNLDIAGKKIITELNHFSGKAEEKRMKGSLYGGGTDVVIKASDGIVKLNYR